MIHLKILMTRRKEIVGKAKRLFALGLLTCGPLVVCAADWPGFRGGPRCDGMSTETGLLSTWPTNGPAKLWSRDDLPQGHACPVVVAGTIFLAGKGVTALNLADGREQWQRAIPTGNATPAFAGSRLFVQGRCVISALDATTGKTLWSVPVLPLLPKTEWRDNSRYDSEAGSPVAADGKVFWVCGHPESPVVALDQTTGALAWASQGSRKASNRGYSSPMWVEYKGRKLLIAQTGGHLLVIDAADGRVMAEQEIQPSGLGNVPVFHDGLIFVSSGYGNSMGTAWRLTAGFGMEQAWSSAGVSPWQESILCVDGRIYGGGSSEPLKKQVSMYCQDVKTGEILGSPDFFAGKKQQAFCGPMMTYADGRFYVQFSWGRPVIYLLEANPAMAIVGKFTLPLPPPPPKDEQNGWHGFTAPVVADGRLLLRYRTSLFCYDIRLPKEQGTQRMGAILTSQPLVAVAGELPRGAAPPGEMIPLGHARFRPSSARPVGWRGDGSGVFPGATPPPCFSDGTRWEMVTETDPNQSDRKRSVRHWSREGGKSENIRWRTALPNWSNSSPIVVGDKVFVMSEPVDYAPVLLCLDGNSGAILWQRVVDHLDAIPAADQERAKREWVVCWNLARTGACLWSQYNSVVSEARNRPDDAQAQAALADWNRRAEAVRFAVAKTAKNAGHWGGVPLEPGFVSDELRGAMTWLRQYNCYFHQWELGIDGNRLQVGAYVGYGHPTPVSDGRLVYVYTGYHAAAAYDLEGKLVWLRWLGRYDPVPGERLAKWMDFTQSPVLVDGRLLVAAKRSLTCLDAATGKTLWSRNAEEAHMRLAVGYDCLLSTGVMLQVGGEPYFFWYDGRIYRIRDGQPVTDRTMGNDTMYMSACPLAQGNLLVCYAGKETVAMTFEDQGGDTLKTQIVWRVPLPADARNGLIVDGKVYLPGGGKGQNPGKPAQQSDLIVDLKTGAVLDRVDFAVDHMSGLLRVGDHFVSLTSVRSSGQAIFRVFDSTGKYLTESYLDSAPASAERRQKIASWRGTTNGWHDGYYHGSFHASPFFQGDRIFVRSRDELICVGP